MVQTSPLPDELLFVLMTRSILVCQPEESPLTTLLKPQKILVPQQDRASIKSDCQQRNCEILAPQEITFLQLSEIFPSTQEHQEEPMPSESTTDHHPVNETLVHPVEPLLGTTPLENCRLQNRNQPQDITDILGTTAYEGLLELQKYIQHHCMYPHQTDTVQINAPEYNPDIDGDNQPNTNNRHITASVQGTLNTSQESSVLEDDNSTAPHNITTPKTSKKPIGLMLPPSRYQAFLQQHQINHQKSCIIDAKSSFPQ